MKRRTTSRMGASRSRTKRAVQRAANVAAAARASRGDAGDTMRSADAMEEQYTRSTYLAGSESETHAIARELAAALCAGAPKDSVSIRSRSAARRSRCSTNIAGAA